VFLLAAITRDYTPFYERFLMTVQPVKLKPTFKSVSIYTSQNNCMRISDYTIIKFIFIDILKFKI